MDPMIIDQHSLHLEIRLLAVFLVLELDKCILKAVSRTFVADDLA